MPDRIFYLIAFSYVAYSLLLLYVFMHPTYTWTPREVAREHIYDYEQFPLRR